MHALEHRRARVVVVSGHRPVIAFVVRPQHRRARGAGEARRVVEQRLQHLVELESGTADELQHFGGRCLLLEGLAEVAIARLELPEQPHVLDRDHRLVGERLEKFELLISEAAGLLAHDGNRTDRLRLAQHRRHRYGAEAEAAPVVPRVQGRVGRIGIADVHQRPVEDCRPGRALAAARHGDPFGTIEDASRSNHADAFRLGEDNGDARTSEYAQPALDDGVEDRLRVRRRRRDDAQDLRRRRLPLERLLGLVEQPHVLDGDHRLVGEGLQQRNVGLGEGARVAAADRQCADGVAGAQKRHGEHSAYFQSACGPRFCGLRVGVVAVQVRDIHRFPVQHGTAVRHVTRHRAGESFSERRLRVSVDVEMGANVEAAVLDMKEGAEVRGAQAHGVARDALEDRLYVGRRAADDLEDLRGGSLLLERLLRLVEQARVLDGDDCLVGERLDQRHLLVVEPGRFSARGRNVADRRSLAHQRRYDERVVPDRSR
jgi:hypothetical protein